MNKVKNKFIFAFSFCVIFLIMLTFSTSASFGAATPTAKGLVTDPEGVNIRSSYSTTSSLVGTIPLDGSVTITKERYASKSSNAANTRWYYVTGSYGSGWVRADLLSVSYTSYEGKTTGGVYVRKGAGTSFSSVGTVNEGELVDVRLCSYTTSGQLWYKVQYNGYYRYISGSYVELLNSSSSKENTSFEKELAAFPSSYHTYLRKLHEKYPNWHFKAKNLTFSWDNALNAQYADVSVNTIPSSKPASYKAVGEDTYDFVNHIYLAKDGSGWVAASKAAVGYYMDPRNWLDEINVFMFESLVYDASMQSESMVKDILSYTAIPTSASSSYMKGGKAYNISPVYLASKSRLELGNDDFCVSGTRFTYNGITYSGLYNAYNIGASDSASGDAAKKGLVFAGSGSSYLRPWKTLDLAIRGGAMYIAEDFIGNNQHTLYYERFNVANGLDNIGTHQYMTNTMAAATQANITYWSYSDHQMLNTAFTFEIPVFKNMPASPAEAPGKGNNNCYLDSLKVYEGETNKVLTKSFDRFTSTYTVKNGVTDDDLTIKAVTNASDAKVTVTGNENLKVGTNKITVKVTSSSGVEKYYYINVTVKNVVIAPDVTISNQASTGKPLLKWDKAINADKYEIYRSTTKTGTYKKLYTTTACSFVNTSTDVGKTYYYKVKSVGTTGVIGEATSKIVYRACDLPQPVVTAANVASTGKIRLTWKAIDGAAKYEVYRSAAQNGTYSKIYTTTGTAFINTSAKSGEMYYYKVKAISSKTSSADSAYSKIVYRTCDLPYPVVTAGNRESDGKPRLTWKKVDGADQYEIYRSTTQNGTYSRLYTTTGTAFINTSAKAGSKYYYKVKAVMKESAGATSAYSQVVYRICDLPQPVVTIGNRESDGKLRLTWKKIDEASKYEIYRATSKNGTYTKLYTTTGTAFINTSAKTGFTYYYKVKAISGKTSSANSAYSGIVYRTCDLPRPVVTAGVRSSDGKPRLTWKAIDGAAKYEIYRATSQNGTYTKLYTTTGTSFVNTSAKKGYSYYYKVKAISGKTSSANSAYSLVKSVTSR